MRPRYGPLYTRAVLLPFAQQLTEIVSLHEVRTACDVPCDSGAASAVLAAQPQVETVWCADTGAEIARAAAAGTRARPLHVEGGRIPLADASCDLAVSLFTLGFARSLRREVRRILKPLGVHLIVAWSPSAPPLHERALVLSSEDVCGRTPEFVRQVLWSPDVATAAVHDVVRFDSPALCWSAVVDERPVLTQIPEARLHDVRARYLEIIGGAAAADGTLRLGVDAVAALESAPQR